MCTNRKKITPTVEEFSRLGDSETNFHGFFFFNNVYSGFFSYPTRNVVGNRREKTTKIVFPGRRPKTLPVGGDGVCRAVKTCKKKNKNKFTSTG